MAVFFRANFAASGYPAYNFAGVVSGAGPEWNSSAAVGVGPNGGDALRLTSVANVADGEYGWGLELGLPPPVQGAVWYLRWRQRWTATTNFNGHDPGGPIPFMSGKMLMVPNAGASGIRTCLNWESQHSPTTGRCKFYVGDASGGPQTDYLSMRGTWSAFQIRVQSSSTVGAADGSITTWVDNDNFAAPTQVRNGSGGAWMNSSSGWIINTSDWGGLRLGAYVNKGLAADGVHAMEFAAFEADTVFDPTWASGAPPVIVTGSALMLTGAG